MSAGEIWGSLSVADHVGRRALVAEVLLFDRLVIPTPPPGDDEQKRAWSRNRWNPGRQRRLLDIVGDGGGSDDLAVTVPWTKAKRDQFKAMSSGTETTTAQLGQERGQLLERLRRDAKRLEPDEIGLKPDAMMRTRELLTREYDQHEREYVAKLPSTWVEKIVPAYASFAKANGELRLRPIEKDRAVRRLR